MINDFYHFHGFLIEICVLNIQLGLGFIIAEPVLSGNVNFSKMFNGYKEYVAATCQSSRFNEEVDELVKVW